MRIEIVGAGLFASVVSCAMVVVSTQAIAAELALHPDEKTEVALQIEYPEPGSVVSDFGCGTFVAGRTFRGGFDIAIVLDTSGSTAEASGADINGDGIVEARRGVGRYWTMGTRSSNPDSVLASEVAAAKRLLRDLDPRITRVAVISFSGVDRDPKLTDPTITHVPLTSDFRRVEVALDALRFAGSDGGTDMAAGVRRGFVELAGLTGARSVRNDRNTKLMFFFTDGEPTEPFPGKLRKNTVAVFEAARRARALGIRVHTFAIGKRAVTRPIAAVRLADMTLGEFTPVINPGELSAVLEMLEFADLEQVSIRSRPSGMDANFVHLSADGSWGGFVKLAAGTNRIEVSVQLGDGRTVTEFVDVEANHSETPPSIPSPLTDRYSRLKKDCLRFVTGDRIQTEFAADKHTLEKLKLEIEINRQRALARKSANEQDRSLRLEVEEDEEHDAPPSGGNQER